MEELEVAEAARRTQSSGPKLVGLRLESDRAQVLVARAFAPSELEWLRDLVHYMAAVRRAPPV